MPTLQLILNGGILQATTKWANGNPNAINRNGVQHEHPDRPNGATIDTGSNWFMTFTPITGNVGTTLTKIGTGTWYAGLGHGRQRLHRKPQYPGRHGARSVRQYC